jgi:hypothetical protein
MAPEYRATPIRDEAGDRDKPRRLITTIRTNWGLNFWTKKLAYYGIWKMATKFPVTGGLKPKERALARCDGGR